MQIFFNDDSTNLVKFAFKGDSDNPFFEGAKGAIFPKLEEDTILLGLGDKDKFSKETFKEAIYKLGKYIQAKDITGLSFKKSDLDLDDKDFVLGLIEALKVSSYKFDYYKSEKTENKLENINLEASLSSYEDNINELIDVLDGQFFARNLINLRSNDLYPETLANYAKDELENLGVKVSIYEESEIRDLGLTAFLEVGKGSTNKPRFIVMEYLKGDDSQDPLVFVGKGITYDTGGYSLKSSNGMKTMNSDMGGSASVIGTMKAIAQNKLDVNVVGLVAACENSLSGSSYKPGDVIKARNGMTIEVDNTDAEGRITLADAVNYGATEYKPELIVDLATLTGAVLIALGETYTGAITNNEDAYAKVLDAAKESNEKIWQLPNDDFYKTYNDSDVADIKNSGGRLGASITAGQFVGAFVEDYPWVHLDIAGTAYLSKAQGLNEKGGTGVHVKTLYNLAKKYSK